VPLSCVTNTLLLILNIHSSRELAALVLSVQLGDHICAVNTSVVTKGPGNDLEGLTELLDGVLVKARGFLCGLKFIMRK